MPYKNNKRVPAYQKHMNLDIGDPLMNSGLGGAMKRGAKSKPRKKKLDDDSHPFYEVNGKLIHK